MTSPAIMFEIMALDQGKLAEFYTNIFGWQDDGQEGLTFIRFSPTPRPLFGIIAKATIGKPGWDKGVTFYIQVDNLENTLEKIEKYGGTVIAPPKTLEKYRFRFAMFEDLEHNIVGLMEPFTQDSTS